MNNNCCRNVWFLGECKTPDIHVDADVRDDDHYEDDYSDDNNTEVFDTRNSCLHHSTPNEKRKNLIVLVEQFRLYLEDISGF